MSAWSTYTISREEAETLVNMVRVTKHPVGLLADQDLMDELNGYAYSEEYQDILGVLMNYRLEGIFDDRVP